MFIIEIHYFTGVRRSKRQRKPLYDYNATWLTEDFPRSTRYPRRQNNTEVGNGSTNEEDEEDEAPQATPGNDTKTTVINVST